MRGLSLFVLIAFLSSPALGTEPLRVLEGRIIRALSVHPTDTNRILAGNKGKKAGSALVFESRDGGKSWLTLNGGASLAPKASDVQAVVYGPGRSVLAGTWKHGLYRSLDGGEGFEKLTNFPSTDVRDLKRPLNQPQVIFAATGRDGLFKSQDGGTSWTSLGLKEIFFWSLSVSPKGQLVYAASPEKALYRSGDGGTTWSKVFDRQAAYQLAFSPENTAVVALASERGLFISPDDGESWRPISEDAETKLSSVLWLGDKLGNDGGVLWSGAWANGLQAYQLAGNGAQATPVQRMLAGLPIVHLGKAGSSLLIGTWGHGLFIVQ